MKAEWGPKEEGDRSRGPEAPRTGQTHWKGLNGSREDRLATAVANVTDGDLGPTTPEARTLMPSTPWGNEVRLG